MFRQSPGHVFSNFCGDTTAPTYCLQRQVDNGFAIFVLHVLLSSQQALFQDELDYIDGFRILRHEWDRHKGPEEAVLSPGFESKEMAATSDVSDGNKRGSHTYSKEYKSSSRFTIGVPGTWDELCTEDIDSSAYQLMPNVAANLIRSRPWKPAPSYS